ncbi:hypothetical protein GA0070615_6325 [Micromonospora aurantiaca]|nr:hypothetical protein GA0070615_6325 [Micromonospora aurantiaca]
MVGARIGELTVGDLEAVGASGGRGGARRAAGAARRRGDAATGRPARRRGPLAHRRAGAGGTGRAGHLALGGPPGGLAPAAGERRGGHRPSRRGDHLAWQSVHPGRVPAAPHPRAGSRADPAGLVTVGDPRGLLARRRRRRPGRARTGPPSALLDTAYGRPLCGKAARLAGVLAVAAGQRRRVRRRAAATRPRRLAGAAGSNSRPRRWSSRSPRCWCRRPHQDGSPAPTPPGLRATASRRPSPPASTCCGSMSTPAGGCGQQPAHLRLHPAGQGPARRGMGHQPRSARRRRRADHGAGRHAGTPPRQRRGSLPRRG